MPKSQNFCVASLANELGEPSETVPIPTAPFCWSVAASAKRNAAQRARAAPTVREPKRHAPHPQRQPRFVSVQASEPSHDA